ncbi:MAG: hypothetical protein QOI56_289 [Actinomycetota bacterium]|jgi:uncharacterized cofD-like protein|nr:hypothetical protein [Actinomycetota bacterium]MEA2931504.1 hypothetical protein [Actinomycetota bacterium]
MTKVVALGGGHGLSASLRAIRLYASEVTAVVSVADDGGSSGRLRSVFGIPPPGDLRKCLVALSDAGTLWVDAFEHRFTAGELEGHALGNLVIAGLAATSGDFEVALAEAGRLLGAVGRVIPATREPVVLKAVVRAADGEGADDVEGQVAVGNSGRIAGVWLVPADPEPTQAALDALASAEQVVIGPGSLFTSVLAVVAVPGIREALAATSARKVYVCNLRAQSPETEGYDVAAHVDALRAHGLDVDVVLCHPGALPLGGVTVRVVERPVATGLMAAHDPDLLAAALSDLVG